MRQSLTGLMVLMFWAASAVAGSAAPEDAATGETRFISRARRLTFEGRRAGEGYFSPDGSRLVFQSEREEGNPFFQIYVLDFESGESQRISPGVGKTTCAFFHADGKRILFASTHHDPRSLEYQQAELEFRASGEERRYDWDYDPQMDLYAYDGESLLRLTSTLGYDAEASYSPDGEWIVFTSNRSVYESEVDEPTRQRLETDPAYFAEIYRMRANGDDLQRLTTTAGYDGGPFYSPDGEWIVWRRFDADGLIAEVWKMRSDGSDAEPITSFGSMSWAPYPHPSGEYVFFTSNKLGFSNFELYIVDAAGSREPIRVSFSDGFDGLPVPSPDGRMLSWTSNRHGGKGQIMIGQWDHEAALKALSQAPARSTAGEKR